MADDRNTTRKVAITPVPPLPQRNTTTPDVPRDVFLHDVVAGLKQTPKTIPSKYFYDRRGSELFEQICELDEYYPTRTELGILREQLPEIMKQCAEFPILIEYGSGSSLKTQILLEALDQLTTYVPIDISADYMMDIAQQLRGRYPHLEIHPLVADYSQDVPLPENLAKHPKRIVFFPGSSLGNFTPPQAVDFLTHACHTAGPKGAVLIGIDLRKDKRILEAAYNDQQGITAEFNLNLLSRINTELGGNFTISQFEHQAIYNTVDGRIEMHLRSTCDQTVRVGEEDFSFRTNETIVTEYSYKYTLEDFANLALQAGLQVQKVWKDPASLFSLQWLQPTLTTLLGSPF
jgi:dimethylhistidine N-methyltransferase